MSFNISNLSRQSFNQVYIKTNKPGFKSLRSAQAHKSAVATAQGLRESAEASIEALKKADMVDIGPVGSADGVDLAEGKGHVIMLDGQQGFELKYNPDNGKVASFTAEMPGGRLSQSSTPNEEGISPTYKWEQAGPGQTQTTFFKFDDKNGILAILDPDNENPAILGGVPAEEVEGGGLVLNPLGILTF